MNIAFLMPMGEFYSPTSGGAIATIAMQFARQLQARGHAIHVLTQMADDHYPVGTIHHIESRQRHELSLTQRAVAKIQMRVEKWDRAYYKWYRQSFLTALSAMNPAPDVVMAFNDFVSPVHIRRALPHARILLDLQNEERMRRDPASVALAVHRFIACSQHIRRWTTTNNHLPDDQFVVINNGVDNDAFHPRDNFTQTRDKIRVLFLGRIDPNKGPDLAADAVAALQREGLPVEMSVAGGLWFYGHGKESTDPYFLSLKTKMESIHANFLGYVTRPNVPAVVRDHDIVCVLSRSNDPNPLVCLEGMASGCAVIASDRGGLPDACDGAGIMVNPDNLDAVINAMRTLVASPQALAAEKQRSIARAAKATWSDKTNELEAILHT